MFSMTKIALAAAIVLSTAFAASAATKPQAVGMLTGNDVIPGYDKDGRTVAIPNPDLFGPQSKR